MSFYFYSVQSDLTETGLALMLPLKCTRYQVTDWHYII